SWWLIEVDPHRGGSISLRPSAILFTASVFVFSRFNFSSAGVKHGLGVAVRRLASFEDQGQGRLKGDTLVVVGRHVSIVRITGILAIDDFRHPLKRLNDHLFGHDSMLQP